MNTGIYCIENLVNGKKYIGQSVNLDHRLYSHLWSLRNNKHYNKYLQKSFDKYGEENFIFRVLLYCEPDELTRYEQALVDLYKEQGVLYNGCLECVNTRLGTIVSQETRGKLSKSNTGKTHSEETKLKISQARIGKKHSEETKLKISKINTGRVRSEKEKQNIHDKTIGKNNHNFGKSPSKEVREKMSLAKKGENNPRFGKVVSLETRDKISKALTGKEFSEEHKQHISDAKTNRKLIKESNDYK